MTRVAILLPCMLVLAGAAPVGAFEAQPLHDRFVNAFNARDWQAVRAMLAEDIVFHRANATEVFAGPEAVLDHWSGLIGADDQWNVKFAILDSDSTFVGNDGRAVERGDFAVTAGADSGSCYRGSYLMTWVPEGDDWRLQLMGWQDVETDLAQCKT